MKWPLLLRLLKFCLLKFLKRNLVCHETFRKTSPIINKHEFCWKRKKSPLLRFCCFFSEEKLFSKHFIINGKGGSFCYWQHFILIPRHFHGSVHSNPPTHIGRIYKCYQVPGDLVGENSEYSILFHVMFCRKEVIQITSAFSSLL